MVVTPNDLSDLRERYKDKVIVLGSGVFDLLHYGHVKYIHDLKQHGDVVVVMVKSDARVRGHKHTTRPIIPEQDRVRVVDAIKGVDYAFVSPYEPNADYKIDPAYEAVFHSLKPDVFYSTNPEWKKLESLGQTKVVIGPRNADGFYDSTTAIIQKIKEMSL